MSDFTRGVQLHHPLRGRY